MAIGDTVQAGLMRIDTSAIERAGQAQAKANQAFGLALGEVAKGYFVGQEKKARANEIKEELMRQGVPEDAAGNISKNPFLQKEHARKEEAENRMDIARMAQRSAGDALAQKAAFEENRIKEKTEAKQITREANQLMRTRPQTETPEFSNLLEQFSPDQIPGTPEFEAKELSEPMGARPPLMASFATDKPNFEMFNVGKAPIEQQLPESFQGQAGRIIDMADNNQISPEAADLALNRIQAQAMAEQKAGPTRSEILAREKYEDEKATRKSEKEILDTESTNNLTDFYNETSGLLDKINEKTVDVTGPIEGTSVYRFFSKIGDTDDEQVRRRLEMFTRKLTLDAAQNLKGALSDKDIRFLVEQAPDMDDNPSVWKKYMGDLKTRLERNATQKSINFEDTNSPQQSANTIDPADLENAVQAKRDLLQRRKLMSSQNEVGISPVN